MPLQLRNNRYENSTPNDSFIKKIETKLELIENNKNIYYNIEIKEKFFDGQNKPLAVFFSTKNDISPNVNDKDFILENTFEKNNNVNNSINNNNYYNKGYMNKFSYLTYCTTAHTKPEIGSNNNFNRSNKK